jgi:outer membrane receptor protein involved in Fe transport
VHEELTTGWGRLSFGARRESVRVQSFGNPDVARFVPASRSFNPTSYALGALWHVAPGWQLTSGLASTRRAPKDYELFADGPHVATAAYELGNAALQVERSTNADVGLQWKGGANSFRLNAFASRFANYIALESTGNTTDDLPEFAYRQVRARFTGLEASGQRAPAGRAANAGPGTARRPGARHQPEHGPAAVAHRAAACGCHAGVGAGRPGARSWALTMPRGRAVCRWASG